jgi:hypothetical protein
MSFYHYAIELPKTNNKEMIMPKTNEGSVLSLSLLDL